MEQASLVCPQILWACNKNYHWERNKKFHKNLFAVMLIVEVLRLYFVWLIGFVSSSDSVL